MLRVIDEVRPSWVIGENVAGLATMVEGGVLTDMGIEASLFGEVDGVHRYGLRERFTIERICTDLEGLGYSVQPVLIPAASIGAPHRRDRIFVIAHAPDADHDHLLRVAGADAGKGGAERVQERDAVQLAGVAGDVRSEGGRAAADTHGAGREEPQQPRRGADCEEAGAGLHDRAERPRADGPAAYADNERLEGAGHGPEKRHGETADGLAGRAGRFGYAPHTLRKGLQGGDQSRSGEEGQRVRLRRDPAGHRFEGLRPEERWANFPTVSPIHGGNDGLPFPLDDLTIPASRWRTESLKAYGNAIVPQVMYRIFQAIEQQYER